MRHIATFALAASACLSARAAAQGASPAPAASCVDTLPASAFQRTLVQLTSANDDSAAVVRSGRADEIDLFTQSVAQRVRDLLGAAAGQLPAGEPAIGWRDLATGVTVVVARDGAVRWSADSVEDPVRRGAGAARLLGRAIDSLRAEGELAFHPDSAGPDSIRFTLHLRTPVRHADGRVDPVNARVSFPMATVLEPWSEPTRMAGRGMPPLPPREGRWTRIDAHVSFVVDTAGRVDPATIREGVVTLTPAGSVDAAARAFLADTRGAVEASRWAPARLGGCVVPELVRMGNSLSRSSFRY